MLFLTTLKKGVCLSTMGDVKVRIFISKELIKFCFEGNGNNFDSEKACQESCPSEFLQADICKIEKEVGPCRDLVERFYFDSQMGTCQKFYFGGCEGKSYNKRDIEFFFFFFFNQKPFF